MRGLSKIVIAGEPSRTAYGVAVRRAAHQVWDNPRVFEDPVALKIIASEDAANLKGPDKDEPAIGRHLRAFITARSRFAEDQLAEAFRNGVRQYVVLGAGLDTFAYRNPFAELKVFEVDYPATQAWKQNMLKSAGIQAPSALTFVPIDFQTETITHGLERAGFSVDRPAFFSWLGVTPYLTNPIVLETLRQVISMNASNGVAFDYAVPRSHLTPVQQLAFDSIANRVAASGEPFVGFFDPNELALELQKLGFAFLDDLDAAEINRRYFDGRTDDLRAAGGGHLICARG